jgi:hypothetical protein
MANTFKYYQFNISSAFLAELNLRCIVGLHSEKAEVYEIANYDQRSANLAILTRYAYFW